MAAINEIIYEVLIEEFDLNVYLDSISIMGKVGDAMMQEVSVMLHEL